MKRYLVADQCNYWAKTVDEVPRSLRRYFGPCPYEPPCYLGNVLFEVLEDDSLVRIKENIDTGD